MPSTYAHYRFGKEVLDRLGEGCRAICAGHKDLFMIGLHGPDILFYHDPLHRNPVSRIGFDMHERPGREFFGPARDRLGDDPDPAKAYLYGFVCHFALDSEAHPYIEDYIHRTGVAHTAIEGEFDRMLLETDGKEPKRTYLAGHIGTDEAGCEVISCFLDGTTPGNIRDALDGMRKYNKVLLAPGPVKRRLVERALRRTGNYDDMVGLILRNEPDTRCVESDDALMRIYTGAVGLAVELIGDLDDYLEGRIPDLPARFDRTFSFT